MSTISIDQDECLGCESCVEICPAAFEMNDDGKAVVLDESCQEACVQEAAEACPAECIKVED